jgi:hypothetical protein
LAITDYLLGRNAEATKAMIGTEFQFNECIGNGLEEWWRILDIRKEFRSVGFWLA